MCNKYKGGLAVFNGHEPLTLLGGCQIQTGYSNIQIAPEKGLYPAAAAKAWIVL